MRILLPRALREQIIRLIIAAGEKLNFYPYRIPVSEKYSFVRRFCYAYLKCQWVFKTQWFKFDQPAIKAFENAHRKRQRCFIIGNGPSLNQMDLTLLKDEITFGANGIYLKLDNMGFLPNYYTVVDHFFYEDRKDEINSLKGPFKFFPIASAHVIRRDESTIFLYRKRPDPFPQFSTDISNGIYGGHTVTFESLQLAYFMGFRKVYLIGIDHNYRLPEKYQITQMGRRPSGITSLSDDPNHFDRSYFGKGYRWHDPQMEKMESAYKLAKNVFESDGRKVINATAGGKLEIFERVKFENLF